MPLLSEVPFASARVEIVLDDAYDFSWGDAEDVARDDISRTNRIIDDQHCQLVTSRAIYPYKLTVLEQPLPRFSRMQPYCRATLGITAAGGDVVGYQQPGLESLHNASSLIWCAGALALPTAT